MNDIAAPFGRWGILPQQDVEAAVKKFVLSLSLLALGVGAALAQDVVAERQGIMKERAGILRKLSPYAKGEQDYDAAQVQALLSALDENARKKSAKELFPEGSEAKPGEDNEASPKIWEDWVGFQASWDKYDAATAAAAAAKPQDAAALTAQFSAVGTNCGGCHKVYRIQNN